jgi:hypothetical protein
MRMIANRRLEPEINEINGHATGTDLLEVLGGSSHES